MITKIEMKIETTTTISMDDNEFNQFVNDNFPAINGKYEIAAFNELGNDTKVVVEIDMAFHEIYHHDDEYTEFNDFRFAHFGLCHILVQRGIIPTGTIIIDCSW